MIAPFLMRNRDFVSGDDSDVSPSQTLVVSPEQDLPSLRRTCFQLALASHDGHVRIARLQQFTELASHAEGVSGERRAQCRILANLTFRDGASLAAAGTEARLARGAWVRASQALLCGDVQTFHEQVTTAESLLENALLQASLAGDGQEGAEFYIDLSLAVQQQRLQWSGLCQELASSQAAS